MTRRKNTNSPWAALAVVIGAVVAFLWDGWTGVWIYTLGGVIGGIGTGANAIRAYKAGQFPPRH